MLLRESIDRGHYTDSATLSQYFRAMIWLGTIDFRLIETQSNDSQIFHRPQFEAMVALFDLFDGGLLDNWNTLHATISTFVGQDDSMTPAEVPALEQVLGVQSSAGLATLDDAAIAQAVATGRFGTQRIDSYILIADPHAGTLPLNSSFLVFGQRFTVDSFVLSNVVYDRVNHPDYPPRMMPKPLDAAFAAMGNGDALPFLAGDLATYGWYPQLIAGVSPVAHKPTIADIFMDPDTGTVLEVGTGDVNPMVVVVETCVGPRAFAGLSLSYYETTASNFKPLTDNDWVGMLATAARPDWLAPVLVP